MGFRIGLVLCFILYESGIGVDIRPEISHVSSDLESPSSNPNLEAQFFSSIFFFNVSWTELAS